MALLALRAAARSLPQFARCFTGATRATERLVDHTKRLRNLVDGKKLDAALEFFADTWEAPAGSAKGKEKSKADRYRTPPPGLNFDTRVFLDFVAVY
jgi:hypothetical protein